MKSFSLIRSRQISAHLLRSRLGNGAKGRYDGLRSSICSMSESPEIPAWLNLPQGEDESTLPEELQEDFIIPSKIGILTGIDEEHAEPKAVSLEESRIEDTFSLLKDILNSLNFTSPDEVFEALKCCTVGVSTDQINKILKMFSNDWISAYGFFKWAATKLHSSKHSPQSFDLMVDILGKSKQFDEMWSLVEQMNREKLLSLATMGRIMRRLSGAGRWDDAIETFHNIESFNLKKDTLAMNLLLDTLCKERSVMRARDVFFEVRESIPSDEASFNIMIHGWCKARKIEEARWMMDDMRCSGFSPSVISYTSLIEAYCIDKNFRAADSVLKEMKANGCSPNVITYTILMHSLGKARETQEAVWVYEMMKNDGCLPDSFFYSSLIYMLCHGGMLRDALSVYEDMHRNGILPGLTTYNTLISSACVHSQEEKALDLLLKMEEDSCKPDGRTYSPLLKYCCRRKRMKLMFFLLEDMVKKGVCLDLGTYTLLVQRLCRNGKLHLSCSFFEKMVLKGFTPSRQTYEMLLQELQRNELDREREILMKLMAYAEDRSSSGHCRKVKPSIALGLKA